MKKNEYVIFEKLLKEKGLNFEKEVLLKSLMHNSKDFKHNYRLDYVINHKNGIGKLIIEIEGGVFTSGRHTKGVGFWNDILKYNSIILSGYPFLRFAAIMIKQNPVQVVELLEKYVNLKLTTTELSNFVEKHKIKQKRKLKK
jgi:very-short-patch-repair endonuclease